MRRAYHDTDFILDEDGNFIGINLGYDSCAEHEWGIKTIQNLFGIGSDPKAVGLDKRKITSLHQEILHFSKEDNEALLIFDRSLASNIERKEDRIEWILTNLAFFSSEKNIVTAWNERGFAIRVRHPRWIDYLQKLYEGFLNLDIAIGRSGNLNPFAGNGLTITLVSAFPQDAAETLAEKDRDYNRLQEADLATGIKEELKKSGKNWFALSPRWASEFNSETEYEVMYWLNPREQDIHNFGWYTVEDLKLWAKDAGPVMKEKL